MAEITVLYFAWVRERIGRAEEVLSPPADIATVGACLDWLAGTSPEHAAALGDRTALRVAVDQVFADEAAPLPRPCELAIFPPMTGG